MKNANYTVIYRTGGTAAWAWHQSLTHGAYADMKEIADEVEKAGRKALVVEVNADGLAELPETWDTTVGVQDVVNVRGDRVLHGELKEAAFEEAYDRVAPTWVREGQGEEVA